VFQPKVESLLDVAVMAAAIPVLLMTFVLLFVLDY